MARERYKPGDNWIIDDITGLKIRASESTLQWDGLRVHKRVYAPRHPQDFVRARADRQAADVVRPQPIDTFIGPLTTTVTALASPGAISIRVVSTAGMRAGDRVSIILSNGDTFRTTILTLYAIGFMLTEDGSRIVLEDGSGFLLWEDQTDANSVIGLADALPESVHVGSWVYDNSAMAEAELP